MHKLKQEEFKDFQVLLHKFQDIQGLEFLFSNSRTFKDFQVLYEPCQLFNNLILHPRKDEKTNLFYSRYLHQWYKFQNCSVRQFVHNCFQQKFDILKLG